MKNIRLWILTIGIVLTSCARSDDNQLNALYEDLSQTYQIECTANTTEYMMTLTQDHETVLISYIDLTNENNDTIIFCHSDHRYYALAPQQLYNEENENDHSDIQKLKPIYHLFLEKNHLNHRKIKELTRYLGQNESK